MKKKIKKTIKHLGQKTLPGDYFDLDKLVNDLLKFKADAINQLGATQFTVYLESSITPCGSAVNQSLSLNAYKFISRKS